MSEETTDPAGTEETPPGPDGRFDADYVQGLRSEAAERRRKGKEAEPERDAEREAHRATRARLLALEVADACRGILADSTDLSANVAADELVDEEGNRTARFHCRSCAHSGLRSFLLSGVLSSRPPAGTSLVDW